MSAHLDEEIILGLVEGRLAAGALDNAEAHLDGCESCREVVTQLAKANAPPPRELVVGQRLGKYVVGELLGAGAMGRVYSAHQPELDRKVAIKVLHDTASSDRLLKEAQAMARLDHPNVVGVYEVGTLDDGGVYAVMDLVTGDTLRTWAESTHDWREITRVLIEIARGLAAVHAAGVVHRDIKPDNIIVGTDGRARLGDFGLARGDGAKVRPGRLVDSASFDDTVVAGAVAQQSIRAASGTSVAGTPVYMALELLKGGAATPASDQFAFGVTAYELFAGKRPFTGATWDALAKAVEGTPPTLREVPSWLDAAIRRCLAIDPSKRFPSMSAVADHLGEHVQRRKPLWIAGAAAAAVIASGVTFAATRSDETPVVAGPTCTLGSTEIATVWNATAREQLASLGAPAIAAIDGWSSKWAAEHDATCEASRTAPISKTTVRERCLTRQRDELTALLDRARSIAKTRNPPDTDRNATNSNAANDGASTGGATNDSAGTGGAANDGSAGRRFGSLLDATRSGDRLLDALAAMSPEDCRSVEPGTADPFPASADRAAEARSVERELPRVRAAVALGDPEIVLPLSASMVDKARASTHAPSLAEALLARGEALRAVEQFDEAAIAARDAVAAAERGHDDQTSAKAWLLRVGIAVDRRELPSADDLGALADATVDRAGAPPRLAAQLLKLRGVIAYYRDHLVDAKALLDKARARYVTLSGERSVDVAGVETMLGATARAAGDLDAAERHHRAALAIDQELRGADHPDVSRDLHNLAGVLRLNKDLDGALATYLQALAIEVKRGGRSVQAGLTHNSIGLVKLERRDFTAARAELTAALDILSATKHGDRAFAEHNLGLVDAATNHHVDALAHYDRAAALFSSTIGQDTVAPIRIHLDRARSLAALGRREQARASAMKAIDNAMLANVPWIVDDAKALLATLGTPVVKIDPQPTQPRPPATSVIPKPDIPPLPPVPIKDVGSYGANPGRP